MTSRNVEWTENAWDEYIYWQTQDKKILKRINTLIRECQRTPFEGTGKPEPLKANLSGLKEVDRFIIWENEKNAVKKDNKVIDAEIID